jgi:hypothetical protein
LRYHKDWLKAFIEYAEIGEAPITLYFWTGVATIAGALRRHVWIDQTIFQWVPNFYIIIVAPPGIISKTTTIDVGINLLRAVPRIHFGPQVITWQKLAEKMAKSLEMFRVDDSDLLYPMSAITVASGELGNFLNPKDSDMINTLISLWDGRKGVFDKETKTQGDDTIENPFINMIGCTTPSWIEDNFSESMIGGGFTSRCIFLHADKKRNLSAYPSRKRPAGYEELQTRLIHDLTHIAEKLVGEYKLTEDAYAWGEQWYADHYAKLPTHMDSDRMGGYLARKQTHIHKLAMVLAASEGDELVIPLEILQKAEKLVSSLEADMPKVFERIGSSQQSLGATRLVSAVRAVGVVTDTELYKHLFRTMSYEDYCKAKQSALAAGHIIQTQEGNQILIKVKHGN